jgi:WD repeat-containing protein mio
VYNDLLAIGLRSGVVDICRLDQALPISDTSFQTTQAPVSLSMAAVRNKRTCTSLAFCQLNPNLLANGLDRSKSEYALLIWDLESSAPIFKASAVDNDFDRLTNPLPNSGRLPKSSLHLQPRSVIPSSGLAPILPGQELQRAPSRSRAAYQRPMPDPASTPRGQFCQAEGINSCVFQTHSSWDVVAGVNNKLIRYFDLRVNNKAVKDAKTRAVRGICCDPIDGNLIASLDDVGVHVWDKRQHTYPILTFQEEDAGVDMNALITRSIPHAPSVGRITGVEFCNTRRNILGTTTRDGSYVRLWNLVTGEQHGEAQVIHDRDSEITDSQAQTSNDWVARDGRLDLHATPSASGRQHNVAEDLGPILTGTRRSRCYCRSLPASLLIVFQPRSSTRRLHPLTLFREAPHLQHLPISWP